MRIRRSFLVACFILAVPGVSSLAQTPPPDAGEPSPAGEMIAASGISTGLFLALDCADSRLLESFARTGRFLSHGLSTDAKVVAATRAALAGCGLTGLAGIDRGGQAALPYVDELADLVVVEDFLSFTKAGPGVAEVLRVVRPGGAACLGVQAARKAEAEAAIKGAPIARSAFVPRRAGGVWLVVCKARPKGMDEWTHAQHGPDGNAVSMDQLIEAPTSLRWLAGPTGTSRRPSAEGSPGFGRVTQVVSAAGRNFYRLATQVVARDSFNGLVLWIRPTPGSGELAAVGDRVYVVAARSILVLDAATGEVVRKLPGGGTGMMVLGDRLVVVQTNRLTCFDIASGEVRWQTPPGKAAPRAVASDGKIYCFQAGVLTALSSDKGEVLWKADRPELGRLIFVHGNLLLFQSESPQVREFHALSVTDGSPMWKYTAVKPAATGTFIRYFDEAFFANGLIWVTGWDKAKKNCQFEWRGLDPAKGELVRTWDSPLMSWDAGCNRLLATDRFAISKRPCDFMSWQDGSAYPNSGARGTCERAGFGLANGLFYPVFTGIPFACSCGPFITGVAAWGAGQVSTQPDEAGRLETGPGRPAAGAAAAPEPWSTYRGNARRTSSQPDPAPDGMDVLWTAHVDPGKWPQSDLRSDWVLYQPTHHLLTGPTLGDDTVFVSLTQAGRVVALRAADGRERWSFQTGGRLDAPPSIAAGLCVVGSHDGYVYALATDTGQLVWRFRAAPAERRMVAFGQIESVWPVVGGACIEGDLVVAVAGRSTEADGGFWMHALDLKTGQPAWSVRRPLTPQPGKPPIRNQYRGRADVPSSDGASAIANGVSHALVPGRAAVASKGPSGTSLFFNNRILFGLGGHPRSPGTASATVTYRGLFETAADRRTVIVTLIAETGPKVARVWQLPLPPGVLAESMILCGPAGEQMLLAVSTPGETATTTAPAAATGRAGVRAGELWVVATNPGEPKVPPQPAPATRPAGAKPTPPPIPPPASVAKRAILPAAPVHEGVAIARGRVYVSLEDGTIVCLGAR